MEERKVKRGDIYYVDLDPIKGSEQGGMRPVLNLQNGVGNKYSPTIIIAAITSRPKNSLPTHVLIEGIEGLEKESVVLLEQLRTIDKIRLQEYIGTLDKLSMQQIDDALCISLELPRKQPPMRICLCATCARQFYDSKDYYIKRADMKQVIKEPCMFCSVRQGYDFIIKSK